MPRTTTHSTVPNQIVITIHREMPKKDFIQIKKEKVDCKIKLDT